VLSRNLKASLQKERTKFRAKVNLNEEQCIKVYLLLHKIFESISIIDGHEERHAESKEL
jgi:hypothetical protein